LVDLARLPNAAHLDRIYPQTVAVDVLVAIITISATKTVTLRRRTPEVEMDIVEVLFGDETRSGFTVSFWLAPPNSARGKDGDVQQLRKTLGELRAGDLVLVRNIALHTWKGLVCGQSLARRWARNSTMLINLVDRPTVSESLLLKWERVKTWRDAFVG
ncbi:hypothetical protein K470DRAFT_192026, partial [Piedraia hortae CBS 480.64]